MSAPGKKRSAFDAERFVAGLEDEARELASALDAQAWERLQGRAERILEPLYKAFTERAGNERARMLLLAIENCARFQLPAPAWAAEEFARAVNAWCRLEVASLDEAFGAKPDTPKHLAQRRAKMMAFMHDFPLALDAELAKAEREGRALDWESLAKRLGRDVKSVQNWYYHREPDGTQPWVLAFPLKSRKKAG